MDLWKAKLAAFLHDPPEKCLDIQQHEAWVKSHMTAVGLDDSQFTEVEKAELSAIVKAADHFAAAADRFVFPQGKCSTHFNDTAGTSQDAIFIHPLCSRKYEIKPLKTVERYNEILNTVLGGIKLENDFKARFFHVWRSWRENAAAYPNAPSPEIALFPADTRIPDHTIWNHNTTTSALAGCYYDNALHPAFLMFQLGPVQDFIAQARSTRDLWSGSYLLSWLVAHAMKAISDEIGPDAIIFPNLRGNGIFDALHREQFYGNPYQNENGGQDTAWKRMLQDKEEGRLLTPTLPNRFLALVPQNRAEELAKKAAQAIHDELKAIGDSVWSWLETEGGKVEDHETIASWRQRWDSQIAAFPQISWAWQPWLELEQCLGLFKKLPVNNSGSGHSSFQNLQDFLQLSEEWLPQEDRDTRYYSDAAKTRLNNPGILWEAHYALVDAKLAARRNTRDFQAWKDDHADGAVKDSLSGKEEVIGSEKLWEHLNKLDLFSTSGHRYGAMNLIKRLWCAPKGADYLRKKLGLSVKVYGENIGFDSVQEIAAKNQYHGSYVALLAMDGDEMGKWVSGEKAPWFIDQLSCKASKYLKGLDMHEKIESLQRLLTPSYHQQLSEALANFATWLAQVIVKKHEGELIYAGGDDVLAILPSDRVIACAQALKDVFCGASPEQDGFAEGGVSYPLILPGNSCTVSIGLAIGHQKAPLQMLVREAQAAESRAKHDYGRNGIAFSIFKHSGETLQWGCKWDSHALPLMSTITKLMKRNNQDARDKLSSRFPYALAQLLAPYQLDSPREITIEPNCMKNIIQLELQVVVRQQGEALTKEDRDRLLEDCQHWLDDCFDKQMGETHADFIKPFLSESFINRAPGEQQ